jgi:GNAT superfamily N-acetyltransferase
MTGDVTVRPAAEHEVALILSFIRELAQYERLAHEVVATEELLQRALFGPRRYAEVVFACVNGAAVGFALYFFSFSTFLGRPGLYLEDLFVRPEARGRGIGTVLLKWLATHALERGCGRLEWAVLDWNTDAMAFYLKLGALFKDDWKSCRLAGAALEALAARD